MQPNFRINISLVFNGESLPNVYFSSSIFYFHFYYLFFTLSFFLFCFLFVFVNFQILWIFFNVWSYTFKYRDLQMFISQPNLLHPNVCERNHEDVNDEFSARELKMN